MRAHCDWCGMDVEVLASGRCLLGHAVRIVEEAPRVTAASEVSEAPPPFPGDLAPARRGRPRKPYTRRREPSGLPPLPDAAQARDLRPAPAPEPAPPETAATTRISKPWAPVEPDGPSGPVGQEPPGPVLEAVPPLEEAAPAQASSPLRRAESAFLREVEAAPRRPAPRNLRPVPPPPPQPAVPSEEAEAAVPPEPSEPEPERTTPSVPRPPREPGAAAAAASQAAAAVTDAFRRLRTSIGRAREPAPSAQSPQPAPSAQAPEQIPPAQAPQPALPQPAPPAPPKRVRTRAPAGARAPIPPPAIDAAPPLPRPEPGPSPSALDVIHKRKTRLTAATPRNAVAWGLAIAATFAAGIAALVLSPSSAQEPRRAAPRSIVLTSVPGYTVEHDAETETRLRAELGSQQAVPRQLSASTIRNDDGDIVALYQAIVFANDVAASRRDLDDFIRLFAEGAGISPDAFAERPLGTRMVWSGLLDQGQAMLLFRGPEVVIVVTADIGVAGDTLADAILTARNL